MDKNKSISNFALLTIYYVILTFLIKICELVLTLSSGTQINDFSGIIYSNFTFALFISFCLFIIYFPTSLLSEKIARLIVATLFSTATFAEIGLIIYHKTTGLLMGYELFDRPLWEILLTIKSMSNIWAILLALVSLVFLTFTFIKISNRKISKPFSRIIIALTFISAITTFLSSPDQDKNIVNKTWYCLDSSISENRNNSSDNQIHNTSQIEYNQEYIDKYKELYPNRTITNDHYPLERIDDTENVLGSYFEKSDTKPNIVFVIVESLGSDFLKNEKYNYTMVPFLDSLAKHSLVWNNCLSTTPRSSGVVPAITSSVPHGRKGFQFGDIPECNSLLAILKQNGYKSNVFYACPFNFDRISDFLTSQEVDYMSPFHEECNQSKDKICFDYTSWGYHDKKMFERSAEIIEKRENDTPNIDIFITISQHDNKLVLNANKDLEKHYYDKAEALLKSMPENEYKRIKGRKGFISTFLYSDDALRDFFHSYTKKHDNTIFIITGDHSLNINNNNPLNAFHVPLIIWSPLLQRSQHFHSVISHNDIAPSITALLRDNFNFRTPDKINWISDGLDTTQNFQSNAITYFMMQSNKSSNLLFNDLYYIEDNNEKKLYKISENLNVQPINDTVLLATMREHMHITQYIDNYTYSNNCITSDPIIPNKKYTLIKSVNIDSAFCASGKEMPSISDVKSVNFFSHTTKSGYSNIKVILTADLKYTADIDYKHFISMDIKCNNSSWHPEDVISKNIVEKDYHPEEWLKLEITKTFDIQNHNKKNDINFFLTPPKNDDLWNPEHTVLLKNININILGIPNKQN